MKRSRLLSVLLVVVLALSLVTTSAFAAGNTGNTSGQDISENGNTAPTGGNTPSTGGNTPSTGGNTPSTGGNTPSTGGNTPSTGGNTPSTGGNTPSTGGNTPSTGGNTPSTGGNTPSTGGNTPSTGGNTPSTGGNTPSQGGGPSSGGAGTAGSKLNYTDVDPDDYYYDPLTWAVQKGVTNGTSATTFSPDMFCTRAQMVTFLWRVDGRPAANSTANPFTDVDANAYYYDALLWAIEKGITVGTSATTFSPDDTCTRAHMVTFLFRYVGTEVDADHPFTDVDADDYFEEAVKWAYANGVTNGMGDGTFGADLGCTRAQMVTFLYRLFGQSK